MKQPLYSFEMNFTLKKSSTSSLISERNRLTNNVENKSKIDEINLAIATEEADENRKIIVDNFKQFSENPEQINMQNMWKLNKKLWPKAGISLPTAKRNHRGKIVSAPGEIKKLLGKEYKDRLRSRPVRPDLEAMKIRKKTIFQMKLKLAGKRKSKEWELKDLEQAIGNMKNNKSRDHEGFINEISSVLDTGPTTTSKMGLKKDQLRIKTTKCPYNDRGYCKFGNECNNKHVDKVCNDRDCTDEVCDKRHPNPNP